MWAVTLTKRAASSWHRGEASTASTSMLWRPTIDKLFRYDTSAVTIVKRSQHRSTWTPTPLVSPLPGQSDAERLADDLSLCRGPGCDQRSCHQCRLGDYGEGGQGLPQTGKRKPNGRLEVLHILWVPGFPFVRRMYGWRQVGELRWELECKWEKRGSDLHL